MRSPKDFFRPLAVGAPEPLREIPWRPSRMIHFFDPSNPKMVAKVPDLATKVDVLLGNLEDAILASNKEAARAGLVEVARTAELGNCQLWTRVNSLDSPWVLDDLTTLVTEVGDRIDVIMVPKVEGPEDIHYVDRLLAQLEAKAGRTTYQQDLWHYTVARMVDACVQAGIYAYYGPFGDIKDTVACEDQFRNAYLLGCVGTWTLHPVQIDIAKKVVEEMPEGGAGAVMTDGKMQDDATYKQCQVVLKLAQDLAARYGEL